MNDAVTTADAVDYRNGAFETEAAAGPASAATGPQRVYMVRLRPDLATHDVASLVHHIRSLGCGEVNAQPIGGAWTLALSSLSDLQLLATKHSDLIEGHSVLNENFWQMPEASR
jgi:hypothetical protein